MSAILRSAALLAFILATLVAAGDVSIRGAAALIPVGLACWVASTLTKGA